jgi:hypothetical protein
MHAEHFEAARSRLRLSSHSRRHLQLVGPGGGSIAGAEELAEVDSSSSSDNDNEQAVAAFLGAAEVLLEQLGVRLTQIPADRADVRGWWVRAYDEQICAALCAELGTVGCVGAIGAPCTQCPRHRDTIAELGTVVCVGAARARCACALLWWLRWYDKQIVSALGGGGGVEEDGEQEATNVGGRQALAEAECWEGALPGWGHTVLPRWEGWAHCQHNNSAQQWKRQWLVVENFRVCWWDAPPSPADDHIGATIGVLAGGLAGGGGAAGGSITLRDHTKLQCGAAANSVKIGGEEGTVYVRLDEDTTEAEPHATLQELMEALTFSVRLTHTVPSTHTRVQIVSGAQWL